MTRKTFLSSLFLAPLAAVVGKLWPKTGVAEGSHALEAVSEGAKVSNTIPQTTDAQIWADEWLKTIAEHPTIPRDRGCLLYTSDAADE